MARRRVVDDWVMKGRGRNFRREMKARGLVLENLEEALGVSAQQLSKYQRGDNLIGAAWACRIASALDCSVLDIFRVEPPVDALAGGVSEARTPFARDDDRELAELLALGHEGLDGGRRRLLRDFILELLDDQETSPRVAPPQGIL